MTILYALGSGSKGNCFALESGGATLLLDAGFSAREIARRADQVGLSLATVVGIALTHEHGDHATGVAQLARKLGVPVAASPGTWACLRAYLPGTPHIPIGFDTRAELGPFTIHAAGTSHDAAEPVALLIESDDGVRLGVAYDLGRPTTGVRFLLRELTALVLEANHDEVLLRTSDYPPSVRQRIAGSGGHLSNRAAAELLAELVHPGLEAIVLAHLSERCNSDAEARATVEPALQAAGFRGSLHVARQAEPLPPLALQASSVRSGP